MTVSDIEGVELRKLHPLTPVVRSWRWITVAGAVAIGAFRDELDRLRWAWDALHGDVELGVLFKVAAALAVITVVAVVAAWLSWRVTGFAFVSDANGRTTLLFHRGLVFRQRRQVRLDRVQAVDVNQPLVPRLAGLAVVQLDMAAGEEASVNLEYLARDDAWALRAEILRHTQGVPAARPAAAEDVDDLAATTTTATATATATVSEADVIARVSTPHLVKATLLDGIWAWIVLVLWIVALVVIVVGWGTRELISGLSLVIPVTIAVLAVTRRQILTLLRDADFVLSRTPTGIRTSSGLTSTTNKTIDLDRIQGVRLIEPYLWRRFGWARVMVDVAGAKGDRDEEAGVALMPVADREDALALIASVTGTSLTQPDYVGPGEGARRLDPLGWRFLGVALLADGVVRRRGRWRWSTSYVPYARVQSVSSDQGPLQRRFEVASVHLDLPKGGERWTAQHRSHADAADLVRQLSRLARLHRVGAPATPGTPPATTGSAEV